MTDVLIFSSDDYDHELELMSSNEKAGAVPLGELQRNIEEFGPAINGVVDKLTEAAKPNGLTTIAIKIGLNAKGKVGFLGNGAEIGGDASITLTFSV
ncbi:MAG: hypothetical protein AAGD43_03240 [Pseudomonadota bacterium]